MTEPYSLDTILSEFSEDSDAWVLQDKTTGLYVTIPHPKYPRRNPIHFFISESEDLLVELVDVNERLKDKEIYPVKVKLIPAIKGIAQVQTIHGTLMVLLCIPRMRFLSL